MKLVFIRHGRAENHTPGMEDAGRRLTLDGSKELKKSMPALKSLTGDQRNIKLWSSPLVRAVQSAKIIADALDIKDIEIHDFIGSGDFAPLSDKLAKLESDSIRALIPLPDALIIVGHQPALSDWCQAICGTAMPFEKGGAVGIRLLSLSPPAGTVEWTADPERAKDKDPRKLLLSDSGHDRGESNPMPKRNKNGPAIRELIKILQYFLQEIQDAQKKFLEEPEEAENLHQIRINIRKFRSLLSFTQPLLIPEDYKTNQEKMRKAGQLFSYLRELDVLQEEWEQIVSKQIAGIPDPSIAGAILKEERDKEKAALQILLSEGVLTTTLLELWSWLSDVYAVHDAGPEKSLEAYVEDQIKKWQDGIRKDLVKMKTFDMPKIHLLRIKSKKLRYIQEIFIRKHPANRNSKYISKVKELQDRLGILCDTRRNIEIADKLLSSGKSRGTSLERAVFIGYLLGKEAGLHLSSNENKRFLSNMNEASGHFL